MMNMQEWNIQGVYIDSRTAMANAKTLMWTCMAIKRNFNL